MNSNNNNIDSDSLEYYKIGSILKFYNKPESYYDNDIDQKNRIEILSNQGSQGTIYKITNTETNDTTALKEDKRFLTASNDDELKEKKLELQNRMCAIKILELKLKNVAETLSLYTMYEYKEDTDNDVEDNDLDEKFGENNWAFISRDEEEFVFFKYKTELVNNYKHNIALMKYYENGDLSNYKEKITPKNIAEIFNGLYNLHKNNIAHRDLKPQNIFIDKNNEFVIGDFDSSIYMNQNNQDYIGISFAGNRTTMAPEVFSLGQKYEIQDTTIENTLKTDVWSLGVTLFLKFFKENYNEVNNYSYFIDSSVIDNAKSVINIDTNMEKEIKQLIKMMLIKNIDERPSIEEVIKNVLSNENDFPILNQAFKEMFKDNQELVEQEVENEKIVIQGDKYKDYNNKKIRFINYLNDTPKTPTKGEIVKYSPNLQNQDTSLLRASFSIE